MKNSKMNIKQVNKWACYFCASHNNEDTTYCKGCWHPRGNRIVNIPDLKASIESLSNQILVHPKDCGFSETGRISNCNCGINDFHNALESFFMEKYGDISEFNR